jgi:hypothetical protein
LTDFLQRSFAIVFENPKHFILSRHRYHMATILCRRQEDHKGWFGFLGLSLWFVLLLMVLLPVGGRVWSLLSVSSSSTGTAFSILRVFYLPSLRWRLLFFRLVSISPIAVLRFLG